MSIDWNDWKKYDTVDWYDLRRSLWQWLELTDACDYGGSFAEFDVHSNEGALSY